MELTKHAQKVFGVRASRYIESGARQLPADKIRGPRHVVFASLSLTPAIERVLTRHFGTHEITKTGACYWIISPYFIVPED